MEEKSKYHNTQSYSENGHKVEILSDEVKMLEIRQAIHDLDSKLTSLEMALNINVKN